MILYGFFLLFVVATIFYAVLMRSSPRKGSPAAQSSDDLHHLKKSRHHGKSHTRNAAGQGKKGGGPSSTARSQGSSDPLFAGELKGFNKMVTCFAADTHGHHVVVADNAGNVRVYDLSAVESGDVRSAVSAQRFVHNQVTGDSLTAVDFSLDGSQVFGALEYSRKLICLRREADKAKKPLSEVFRGSVPLQEDTVRWLVSSKYKAIITASASTKDTQVHVWSYAGDRLASYNPNQIQNFNLVMSPLDGRFVGVAAWSSGVKLMEIVLNKTQEFSKLQKAVDARSECGVLAAAVSPDNSRLAMVCKDGTWRLWNISVRYNLSEDAKLLTEVPCVEADKDVAFLAYSFDGRHVIAAHKHAIVIKDASTLEDVSRIEDPHSSLIVDLAASPKGNYFFTFGDCEMRPKVWELPA
eukprot:GHVU01123004.1.p1 GENE.GHVU01123004.1~~GHVU01123004.1.p1  ORF type:complete len:410 (+),score=83.91 GHVU01123004.1:412-1641(+)